MSKNTNLNNINIMSTTKDEQYNDLSSLSKKELHKKCKNLGVKYKILNNKKELTDLINEKIENKTEIKEDTFDIKYINNRINNEICYDTIDKLKDSYLLDEYIKCESVQNEIKNLREILEKYKIEPKQRELITNDYLLKLIPAGTKGVMRGNKFNSIVKDTIKNLDLDSERFEICFEKQCVLSITTEIPDWYILEKSTGKVIIGMNQLDLWNGGHQINRVFKYLAVFPSAL